MNNDNYVVIQGWMCNELNLSGNELLVFALIYGFSQDGESEFSGSRTYIANTFNISKPTVDKALKSLIEKGYIIKHPILINNVQINRYKVSLGVVKNLYGGSKESLPPSKEILQGGSKESLPYNYNKNKSIKIYSNNKDLDSAIHDFIDHRKKMRKPMTDKAIELFIKKLQGLDNTEAGQIELINNAIEKGWQSVYPLNNKKNDIENRNNVDKLKALEEMYL